MFDTGALTTSTPRLVAATTSTLSSPMPARATTLSLGASGQRLGIDVRGAADDHRIDVGQRGQQRRPVGAVDVADLGVLGQHGERGRSKLFGNENDRSGHDAQPTDRQSVRIQDIRPRSLAPTSSIGWARPRRGTC